MIRRRERIEKWRADRNKDKEVTMINYVPPSKEWTLEDEDDDDEVTEIKDSDDDDVDPLDAFMAVCITHEIVMVSMPFNVVTGLH